FPLLSQVVTSDSVDLIVLGHTRNASRESNVFKNTDTEDLVHETSVDAKLRRYPVTDVMLPASPFIFIGIIWNPLHRQRRVPVVSDGDEAIILSELQDETSVELHVDPLLFF